MLSILRPTFKPVLQQVRLPRLRKRVAEIREYFSFLQKKTFKFCAFYQPKANLFCRKWRKSGVKRDSGVILSNQKSCVFTQFATTWFVARQVSTSVGGKKTSLQQFCKTSCWLSVLTNENKNYFHTNDFVISLALKWRLGSTRKLPVGQGPSSLPNQGRSEKRKKAEKKY